MGGAHHGTRDYLREPFHTVLCSTFVRQRIIHALAPCDAASGSSERTVRWHRRALRSSVHVDTLPLWELKELLPQNVGLRQVAQKAPTAAPHVGTDPPVGGWQRVELCAQEAEVVAHHRQPIPADPTQVAPAPGLAYGVVQDPLPAL